MKRLGFSLLLSLAVFGSVAAQTGSKHVDLKEITDGKFRQVTAIGEMRSLPDGEHYTAMNADKSMIIKYSYRTGNPVDTLFNARKARECTFTDFDGYTISSTGHHILVWRDTESIYRRSTKAVVYDYDVRRNYVKPISDAKGKQMIPTFSPDGRMCAYVRDNTIWIRKFAFDTGVPVTKDGELNKILNGITDWVYEEEFAVTNLMAWSPDSEYLAFVRFDESEVPEYSMQMYGEGLYPGYYEYKYPKAGQKNSKVSVHSYSVVTKDTKEMKVPVEGDFYIPRITFTQNPDQLAIMTLNRQQNVFNMYYANPKSGVFRLILREENKCYVDSYGLSSFHFPVLRSLEEEREEVTLLTGKKKKDVFYIPVSRKLIRVVAASAAAVALFFVVSTPVKEVNLSAYTASFVPTEMINYRFEEPISQPEEIQISQVDEMVAEVTPKIEATKETEIAKAASAPEVKKELVAPAPKVKSVAPKKMYHIVIASFPTEEQANEYISGVDRAQCKNVSKVVRDGKYRIYADKFNNRADAESYMATLRKIEKYKDAWLFISR